MTVTLQKWRSRILLGGSLGVAFYLLLSFLTQPGSLFGGSLEFAFTFCYDGRVPEWLGAALGSALWFAFGAETAVATLPFADEGGSLLRRSALHWAIMSLTLSAWVLLNFGARELPFFLVPFALIYALIWLGRWVGWYAEVAAIREKLGLAPGPSLFKWRETLPYFFFALLLCDVLPFILRALDARDVPVLTGLLLPYLLLPVGGFFSGLSLGKRQGLCPLYPPFCALCYLPVVFLLFNSSALFHCGVVFCAALAGGFAGAAVRHKKAPPAPKDR